MYVGREPRGPSKRFVMSTAKEIVIVEHSEEHSLNASKEAGSKGQEIQPARPPLPRSALQQ
jgi:hypothetical protein